MNLTTKYGVGEEVVAVMYRKTWKREDCPRCKNDPPLWPDGETVHCTQCSGQGRVTVEDTKRWQIASQKTRDGIDRIPGGLGTIGCVRVEVLANEGLRAYRPTVTYMLRETGVGSGQIWHEEDLFQSVGEARAECDIRNAKIADAEEVKP